MTDTYAKDFINFCEGNKTNTTCEKVLYDYLMFLNDEYTYYNVSCELTQAMF